MGKIAAMQHVIVDSCYDTEEDGTSCVRPTTYFSARIANSRQLVAFDQQYDCLANNEFGRVPLIGDVSVRKAKLQQLLEGSVVRRAR
jgi:hypothetical protein